MHDRSVVDRRRHATRLPLLTGAAIVLASGWSFADRPPDRPATVADCTGGGARDVRLDGEARVDGFVVDLGRRANAGVTRVRVRAGEFERVLHVTGVGTRALRFQPALQADTFTVTLEPLASEPGACLERVTLFEGKTRVATFEP